jgi:cytochrome P450
MMTDALEVRAEQPPAFATDPYGLEVLEAPYAFQAALRDAGPVVRIAEHDIYAVGRHEEAKSVLTDHSRFMAGAGIGLQDIRKPGNFRIPSRLLENDPPDHTAIRTVVNRILSPLVIRKAKDDVKQEAEAVLDGLRDREAFNGVDDLVEAYVLRAFPKVVGVQLPRTETLAIGEMRFNQSGPPNALYHRAIANAQPYLEWFEESCSRAKVASGSISDLLFDAEDAGSLPEGVASNIVRSFVGGGTDSTISGLGTTVRHLAQDPDQWAILAADPSKVKTALDEGIRMEAPFQVTYRTTRGPTELAGFALEGDAKIGVFLGAAGRDPRRWENADRFDLTRRSAGVHLSFGTADHACIGQMLARLEAEALLAEMVSRIETIELAGEPIFRPMNQLRTLDSLPLRVVWK